MLKFVLACYPGTWSVTPLPKYAGFFVGYTWYLVSYVDIHPSCWRELCWWERIVDLRFPLARFLVRYSGKFAQKLAQNVSMYAK